MGERLARRECFKQRVMRVFLRRWELGRAGEC